MARLELIDITKRYGEVRAADAISLEIVDGEFLVLLGPSGCGKTTTLRIIAGFIEPTSGRVRLGGRDITALPPWKRNAGLVFQSYALFPHMSVAENVAFGPEMRKVPKAEMAPKITEALRLVRLDHLADRLPRQLSGGQQQRVALARAIAFSPTVVLFDEPLSNLDAKLRAEMRVELRELQRRLGITSVYVTHDQEEALAISDRVIVMNVGVIEQIGTPEEIYNRPRSRFVADFVGSANIVKGRLAGEGLFATEGGVTLKVVASHKPHGKESEVAIRTAYVDLEARPGDNHVPGTVRQRLFHGDFLQYVIDSALGPLIVRRPPVNLLDEGAAVTISFSPEHCVLLES